MEAVREDFFDSDSQDSEVGKTDKESVGKKICEKEKKKHKMKLKATDASEAKSINIKCKDKMTEYS